MLTNNLSVGLAIGYDVVSYPEGRGNLRAARDRARFSPRRNTTSRSPPRCSCTRSAAGGAYQTIPHLGIGSDRRRIRKPRLKPGGSLGIGFDYWLFGTQGLGAEFEYNFFDSRRRGSLLVLRASRELQHHQDVTDSFDAHAENPRPFEGRGFLIARESRRRQRRSGPPDPLQDFPQSGRFPYIRIPTRKIFAARMPAM